MWQNKHSCDFIGDLSCEFDCCTRRSGVGTTEPVDLYWLISILLLGHILLIAVLGQITLPNINCSGPQVSSLTQI